MKKVFLGLLAGLAAYEIRALMNRQEGDTISEIIWDANRRPLVPFLTGMLAGHLFWQRK